MQVSRLRVLCIEVFKTLKNLNPSFMHDIFKIKSSTYSSRNPNDLQHYRPNQVTFGSNSLRSLGPQIWNGLPNEIKSAENLNSFKHLIKKWDGPNCKCNACQHVTVKRGALGFHGLRVWPILAIGFRVFSEKGAGFRVLDSSRVTGFAIF